jgi:Uma2 family endonuclease
MTVAAPLMTADELLRLPDDGYRYELVKGELRKMAPAGHEHGFVAMNAGSDLKQHVKKNRLGRVFAAETGFVLASSPDTVRAPDVAFVRKERLNEGMGKKGYWPGPPDLAVEVVSPGDSYSEVEEKALTWLEAGCLMVIVADPMKRTLTVYRSLTDIVILTEQDVLKGGDVVPGWEMPVKEFFGEE